MLKDEIPNWVRPDLTDKMKQKLNEAANFFKHADRDQDDVLEFSQGQSELLLYDAIRKYRELTGETVPVLAVYDVWFWIGPGEELIVDPERQKLRDQVLRSYPNATRTSFFINVLPLVSSFGR